MFDSRDLASGEDAVLPLLLVGVLDPLDVHIVVNLLNEFKTDHTVVGGLVSLEGTLALFGREVIEFVDTFGVEDLVNTILFAVSCDLSGVQGVLYSQRRVITRPHSRISHDQCRL